MTGKKRVVLVVVVIVVVVALVLLIRGLRQEGDGVIRLSGTVEATTVEVSFKVPGRVAARLVDEGATVRAGELVARLDDQDLVNEVAVREAEVAAARAQLAEFEAGSRRQEIGQAAAAVAAATADAERQEIEIRRVQALYEREVVPKRELDAARSAHESAQARLRSASEGLAMVREGPRRERIDQARARLREAEAALAQSRTRLGYATLTAPMDGVVLAKGVEAGEQVAIGTPVVTIGRLDEVWVRSYLPETEMGRIRLGQEATVRSDTFPDRRYTGKISFIASEAEFTPKTVQTERERVKLVYRIKITLANPQQELKPGMPVTAEIPHR